MLARMAAWAVDPGTCLVFLRYMSVALSRLPSWLVLREVATMELVSCDFIGVCLLI